MLAAMPIATTEPSRVPSPRGQSGAIARNQFARLRSPLGVSWPFRGDSVIAVWVCSVVGIAFTSGPRASLGAGAVVAPENAALRVVVVELGAKDPLHPLGGHVQL